MSCKHSIVLLGYKCSLLVNLYNSHSFWLPCNKCPHESKSNLKVCCLLKASCPCHCLLLLSCGVIPRWYGSKACPDAQALQHIMSVPVANRLIDGRRYSYSAPKPYNLAAGTTIFCREKFWKPSTKASLLLLKSSTATFAPGFKTL